MSNSSFSFEPVRSIHEWDQFIDNSPQGTIFCQSSYLDLSLCQYNLFIVRQGHEPKAAICLTYSDDRSRIQLDDLVIHNGVMFAPPSPNRPSASIHLEQFSIIEYIIPHLFDISPSVQLALSPQINDIRPFLWHNYHKPMCATRFSLDLRYTAYLDISSLHDSNDHLESSLFCNFESLRRRHIRKAYKSGASIHINHESSGLVYYYDQLMKKQGIPSSSEKLRRISNLIDGLIRLKQALVFDVVSASGDVLYSLVYAWDSKRAYYLFGAGHPEISEPWQGSFAHWEAFSYLSRKFNISQIDLEGANSPQRGRFKLSFGAELLPYYQLSTTS